MMKGKRGMTSQEIVYTLLMVAIICLGVLGIWLLLTKGQGGLAYLKDFFRFGSG